MFEIAQKIVTGILPIVDKVIPDKDQAQRIKAELQTHAMTHTTAVLNAQKATILGEINGESWLQRNWRPVTMLTFVALVVAHWMGFTAPNISDTTVAHILEIIKIGLGGYVVGRSAEKIMKQYKK